MKWHKLLLVCEKCGKNLAITSIYTAADGELMVEVICVHCGTLLKWTTSGAKLILKSVMADLKEERMNKPIRPPIKPMPKLPVISDHDWLRQLGIDDREPPNAPKK